MRRGFGFVEAIVAAAVLATLLGVAWFALGGARRGAARAMARSDAVQVAAYLTTLLERDLGAVLGPGRVDVEAPSVRIAEEGRVMAFRRGLRPDDLAAGPGAISLVEWRADPLEAGGFRLSRTEDGEETSLGAGARAGEVRFELTRVDRRVYVDARILVLGERVQVPVRVLRQLPPQEDFDQIVAVLPGGAVEAILGPFGDPVLPDRPFLAGGGP